MSTLKTLTTLATLSLLTTGCVVYKEPPVNTTRTPVGGYSTPQQSEPKRERFVTDEEHEYCDFFGSLTKAAREMKNNNYSRAATEYEVLKASAEYNVSDVYYRTAQIAVEYAYDPMNNGLSDTRLSNIVVSTCLDEFSKE